MTLSRSALTRLAGALLTPVLVAGLASGVSTASAAERGTTEPDPMAGAPSAGDCFNMTYEEMLGESLDKEPVACAQRHTAVTSGVFELPSDMTWESPRADIEEVMDKRCGAFRDALIGDEPRLLYRTQYSGAFFLPTQEQRDAGARWISCMVIVYTATGLGPLPRKLPKLKASGMPDSVTRCLDAKNRYTTCAKRHTHRSTYAFFVRGKASKQTAMGPASRICPKHTSGRVFRYSWLQWTSGQFLVGCYDKTRR